MLRTAVATISLMAALAAAAAVDVPRPADDPGVLLRSAMEKEEVDGDLQGAIDLYTRIVASFADRPEVAAKAQLRIGACFEKLGKAEAVKAYQAVLDRFPGQAEAVAEARARLSALRREEPAELSVERLALPDEYFECATLSRDGTRVAAIDFSKGQNLIVYDLATRETRFVTSYDYTEKSPWANGPVWSPDGSTVAFHAGAWNQDARDLWLAPLGGEPRVLLRNGHGAITPCGWMPDGSAVVVIRANGDGSSSLGLVRVNDGTFKSICRMQRSYGAAGGLTQAAAAVAADVSPDGRRVAFADGPPGGRRDIYIVAAESGDPVALTDHPADDTEPRWSPDGRHLVFLSERHGSRALWGVDMRDGKADGPPFMILEGMGDADLASWTKAGLAFRTEIVVSDIDVVDVDPERHVALGKPRVLDLDRSLTNMGPFWSPDGRYLGFATYDPRGASRRRFTSIMPAAGGPVQRYEFVPSTQPQGGAARWLPDGTGFGAIYWDTDKRYYYERRPLDTGEPETRPIPSGGFSKFSSFAWRPDGKAIYYFKWKGEGVTDPGIVEHELDTGRERYVYHAGPDDDFDWQVKISRDGSRLALDSDGAIVVVDVRSGEARTLPNRATKALYLPAWSPDGRYVVAKGKPDESSDLNELYVVSAADGSFTSLDISRFLPRKSRIMTAPDWSPDGRKIAFDTRTWRSEAKLIRNLLPQQ